LGIAVGVILAYVLGSLPFGFWFAKTRGLDIQKVGSGNTGATNVLRALGPKAAIPVLILDVGKGFFGAMLAQRVGVAMGADAGLAGILGGLGAFAGHNWSFLLRFTGGKGVSAAAGAALFLMPQVVWVAAMAFVGVILITRYVSLGSILAALTFVAATLVGRYPPASQAFAVVVGAVIIFKHRSNIARLLSGKEPKFGQRLRGGAGGKP
jgi:glycerol-3-phosphate acyltransferase PlsY